jgi:hypothetical protein
MFIAPDQIASRSARSDMSHRAPNGAQSLLGG